MNKYRDIAIEALFPLFVLVSLTVVFMLSDLDLKISGYFFDSKTGWFLADSQPWKFLYKFGPVPAILLATGALVVFLLSYFKPRLADLRMPALFLVVVMVVGPGIMVNSAFKEYWGRPRPRDIHEFGGNKDFLYVWEKGKAHNGKSFPSGHASTGFFLIAPWFLLRRKRIRLASTVLVGGLAFGALTGVGRIVQGAHFPSDVLWSAGFVYFSGLALYYLLNLSDIPESGSSGQEINSLPT